MILSMVILSLTLIAGRGHAQNFYVDLSGIYPSFTHNESIIFCKANVPYDSCRFSGPKSQLCEIQHHAGSQETLLCRDRGLSFHRFGRTYDDKLTCALKVKPVMKSDLGEWKCTLGLHRNKTASAKITLKRDDIVSGLFTRIKTGDSGANCNTFNCLIAVIILPAYLLLKY